MKEMTEFAQMGDYLTKQIYEKINSKYLKNSEIEKIIPNCGFELVQQRIVCKIRKHYSFLCQKLFFLKESPTESFNRFLFNVLSKQINLKNSKYQKEYKGTKFSAEMFQERFDECFETLETGILTEFTLRIREKRLKASNNVENFMKTYIGNLESKFLGIFCKKEDDPLRIAIQSELKKMKDKLEEEKWRISQANSFLEVFLPFYDFANHIMMKFFKDSKFFEIIAEDLKKFFIKETKKLDHISQANSKIFCNEKVILDLPNADDEPRAGLIYFFDENLVNTIVESENEEEMIKGIKDLKIDKKSGDKIPILKKHVKKMKFLYEKNSIFDNKDYQYFEICLYSMLKRYDTFFGFMDNEERNPLGEGTSFHAACPGRVMKYLYNSPLSVRSEMFASPMNCIFLRFCSCFGDVDVFFGSYGSFDYCLESMIEGSVEVNPPFTSEVQVSTALSLIEKLKKSEEVSNEKDMKPLSFVVVVADWTDPPSKHNKILNESNYTVTHFTLDRKDHSYTCGGQHIPQSQENEKIKKLSKIYKVDYGSHVYVMQNRSGKEKYKFNFDDFEKEIRKNFSMKN